MRFGWNYSYRVYGDGGKIMYFKYWGSKVCSDGLVLGDKEDVLVIFRILVSLSRWMVVFI